MPTQARPGCSGATVQANATRVQPAVWGCAVQLQGEGAAAEAACIHPCNMGRVSACVLRCMTSTHWKAPVWHQEQSATGCDILGGVTCVARNALTLSHTKSQCWLSGSVREGHGCDTQELSSAQGSNQQAATGITWSCQARWHTMPRPANKQCSILYLKSRTPPCYLPSWCPAQPTWKNLQGRPGGSSACRGEPCKVHRAGRTRHQWCKARHNHPSGMQHPGALKCAQHSELQTKCFSMLPTAPTTSTASQPGKKQNRKKTGVPASLPALASLNHSSAQPILLSFSPTDEAPTMGSDALSYNRTREAIAF